MIFYRSFYYNSLSGQRPHECEICKKSFRQAGQLKTHQRIHKGEKPYQCHICSGSFRSSSSLITHLRTHTGTTVVAKQIQVSNLNITYKKKMNENNHMLLLMVLNLKHFNNFNIFHDSFLFLCYFFKCCC